MMFSTKRLFKIFKEKGHKCWYCGKDAVTLDHYIPKIKGGSNEDENLFPSCRKCNLRKLHRSLETFRDMETRRVLGIPYFNQKQLDYLKKEDFVFKKGTYKFYFEEQGWKIKN